MNLCCRRLGGISEFVKYALVGLLAISGPIFFFFNNGNTVRMLKKVDFTLRGLKK